MGDCLFITFIVPSFALPPGYATRLNSARGREISMPKTG
jgi:hypothetical protein